MSQLSTTSSFARRLTDWGTAHPALYYLAPLALWVVFIAWASLAPPDDLPQLKFDLADKLEHTLCYGVLGALMLRGWVRRGAVTLGACVLIELAAGAWGVYLEFLQRATGYRSFDYWDAASNAIGVLLGLAAWSVVLAWSRRRVKPAAAVAIPANEESLP